MHYNSRGELVISYEELEQHEGEMARLVSFGAEGPIATHAGGIWSIDLIGIVPTDEVVLIYPELPDVLG